MDLPKGFRERMEVLLGEECPDFLKSYDGERAQGLRLNGWKTEEGRRDGWEQSGAAREAELLCGLAGFSCGLFPGLRKDTFMGRTAAPDAARSTRQGSTISRSQAPCPRERFLTRSPGILSLTLCGARGEDKPYCIPAEGAGVSALQRDSSGQGQDSVPECGEDGPGKCGGGQSFAGTACGAVSGIF